MVHTDMCGARGGERETERYTGSPSSHPETNFHPTEKGLLALPLFFFSF